MAKLKYDVSDVEDVQDGQHAPVGIYKAKIRSAESKESKAGNQMIELILDLTHSSSGKKLKEQYMPIWYYVILDHEHPFVQGRFKEFVGAVGAKLKGTLDTDKIAGQTVQLKLKSDTDQDGEYRPRVGKLMSTDGEDEQGEPEPDEDPDDDQDEPEPDLVDEDEDEDEVDLDAMSRSELKALIKEEGLEVKVLKSKSDDDVRAEIAALLEGDEDEEDEDEDEDEDEEGDDDEVDYSSFSVEDLKKELKERELSSTGKRAILIKRLEKDDEEEPF